MAASKNVKRPSFISIDAITEAFAGLTMDATGDELEVKRRQVASKFNLDPPSLVNDVGYALMAIESRQHMGRPGDAIFLPGRAERANSLLRGLSVIARLTGKGMSYHDDLHAPPKVMTPSRLVEGIVLPPAI